MKIEVTSVFTNKLKRQIEYISLDKKTAARKFNQLVFRKIKEISNNPK